MKKLFLVTFLFAGLGLGTAPGCIVHTRSKPNHGHVHKEPRPTKKHRKHRKKARCPRGYHWDGRDCVRGGGSKY